LFCWCSTARTIVVSTGNGEGKGSLSEAIDEANRDTSPDTIVFEGIETIHLTKELPTITAPAVIDGRPAGGVTIIAGSSEDAAYTRRIFTVNYRDGNVLSGSFATGFAGLTLAGGRAEQGGGIYNALFGGKMTVTNCRFVNNRAEKAGGALWSRCHTQVLHSDFDGNECGEAGGAICFYYGTFAPTFISSVEYSVFTNNRAGHGGAVVAEGLRSYTVNILNCIFSENEAGRGGAVSCIGANIHNSVFTGNRATEGDGGAISGLGNVYSPGDILCINSTFFENRAKDYGGAIGAIPNHSPPDGRSRVYIAHSTFTGNESGGRGGALYSLNAELLDNIIAGNKAGDAASNNIFDQGPVMACCAYDQGILLDGGAIRNNTGNLIATAGDIFGTASPQLNVDHAIEVSGDSPASRNGRQAGYTSGQLYYKEDGEWKRLNPDDSNPPLEEITPVTKDQAGNERAENHISMGAWQYPHESGNAALPVRETVEITALSSQTISVKTLRPVRLEVYTAGGRLILLKNLPEGTTAVPLATGAGIYVVKAGGVATKVILKD
jgi:predicted outer membrane repeat protein